MIENSRGNIKVRGEGGGASWYSTKQISMQPVEEPHQSR